MRLSTRDVLDRLRPVGSPGAAAPAGVPVDRRAGLEAELAPVFAALTGVEDECRRIRSAAAAEAARRRQSGIDRARDVLSQARLDVRAERAGAAAELRRRAETVAAELQAQADHEAEEIRQRADRQLPNTVAMVLSRVRDDIRALAGDIAQASRSGAQP